MQREDNSSGEDRRRPAYGPGDEEFVDILHVQQRIFGTRRHSNQPQQTYQSSSGYLYNVQPTTSTGASSTNESDWFTRWFNNAAGASSPLLSGEKTIPFFQHFFYFNFFYNYDLRYFPTVVVLIVLKKYFRLRLYQVIFFASYGHKENLPQD